MIHVYLDDWRRCPDRFVLARNMEECLLLLKEERIGILSLDHDLGPDEPTGTDLVLEMVRRGLYPQEEIYLHTSCPEGRQRMYQQLYQHKPDSVKLHNGPMGWDTLERIRLEKQ